DIGRGHGLRQRAGAARGERGSDDDGKDHRRSRWDRTTGAGTGAAAASPRRYRSFLRDASAAASLRYAWASRGRLRFAASAARWWYQSMVPWLGSARGGAPSPAGRGLASERRLDASAEGLRLVAHARPRSISDAGEELVGADVEARVAAGDGMVVVEHLIAGVRGLAFGLGESFDGVGGPLQAREAGGGVPGGLLVAGSLRDAELDQCLGEFPGTKLTRAGEQMLVGSRTRERRGGEEGCDQTCSKLHETSGSIAITSRVRNAGPPEASGCPRRSCRSCRRRPRRRCRRSR